jgi:AP-3 complex subunit mu
MEDVSVEMYLGDGAGGVKGAAGRSGGGGGFASSSFTSGGVGLDLGGGGMGMAAGASWVYDQQRRTLRWELPNVPPGSSWSLKGSFISS